MMFIYLFIFDSVVFNLFPGKQWQANNNMALSHKDWKLQEQQQQQHQFNDGFSTVQQVADTLLRTQPCPCKK